MFASPPKLLSSWLSKALAISDSFAAIWRDLFCVLNLSKLFKLSTHFRFFFLRSQIFCSQIFQSHNNNYFFFCCCHQIFNRFCDFSAFFVVECFVYYHIGILFCISSNFLFWTNFWFRFQNCKFACYLFSLVFSHSDSIDQLFSLSRFNPLLIFDLYSATLLPVFKFCVKTHFRFRFSIFQRRWLFYNLHNTGCIVCGTNRMERTEVITEISW